MQNVEPRYIAIVDNELIGEVFSSLQEAKDAAENYIFVSGCEYCEIYKIETPTTTGGWVSEVQWN